MNELFKEVIDLSEALYSKVELLSSSIDREGLAAEEYAITMYRDDLMHTLENVKDLTDEELLSLTKEIQRVSDIRRMVKDMVIFFDHKYLQFISLANELNRFNRIMKRDETRYLFKTDSGAKYFENLLKRPYESKVIMDTENYVNKKHSKLISGEVLNVWELVESFKTENKFSDNREKPVLTKPPLSEVKVEKKVQEPISVESREDITVEEVIPTEIVKVVDKEIVETQEKEYPKKENPPFTLADRIGNLDILSETLKETSSEENTSEKEVMESKELETKQKAKVEYSVSETASNKLEVTLPQNVVSLKEENRNYVIQGPNKGVWQLYSKFHRKVVREFFKMTHLLDFIVDNEIYAVYEKGMDKTQVKQILNYLK